MSAATKIQDFFTLGNFTPLQLAMLSAYFSGYTETGRWPAQVPAGQYDLSTTPYSVHGSLPAGIFNYSFDYVGFQVKAPNYAVGVSLVQGVAIPVLRYPISTATDAQTRGILAMLDGVPLVPLPAGLVARFP